MSKLWCPEAFRNLAIIPYNEDKVLISPCCQSKPFLDNVDSFDFNTNDYLVSIRNSLNEGVYPSSCARCEIAEKLGNKSRRQSSIEFYDIEESNEVKLESIDYSSTWACNLACSHCNENFSSHWSKLKRIKNSDRKLVGRIEQMPKEIIDSLVLDDIKKIHFNGGEPLLNNNHYNLLNRVKSPNNVVVSYNTNGTVIPNDEIFGIWRKMALVKLFFSIDATESSFEYIRWPAKWESVVENIRIIKETAPSNVMFAINVSIGCHNIIELQDIVEWFNTDISTNREGDKSYFSYQFVNKFDLKYMKTSVKNDVISLLRNIEEFKGVVTYIESNMSHEQNDIWITALDNVDSLRGTNWRENLKIARYY